MMASAAMLHVEFSTGARKPDFLHNSEIQVTSLGL